jgi:hypothetical protein
MQCTWINDQRRPTTVLFGNMTVAIEEKVVRAAILNIAEKPMVVAVCPGDFSASQFQMAELIVQGPPNFLHRSLQSGLIPIAVSQNEVRFKTLEKADGLVVLNVAAMEEQVDAALAKQTQRRPYHVVSAMRITQDSDSHCGASKRSPTLLFDHLKDRRPARVMSEYMRKGVIRSQSTWQS